MFLERFVEDPRHIEVQILGDAAGTVIHLFERECSIQRRYQKIVEECPSPAVHEGLRAALTKAAVAAGQAIGYTGAGTVEFVLDRDGSFFFLEVNTRLQVEHPVTEQVTGLDLVELQLRIAAGEPLPPQARDARVSGHAIEARLYAEDAAAGFVPATGLLHRFAIPDAPGIRVDAGVADGSVVSPHYDAMLAKVIGHGRTRAEAAGRLARVLRRAEIHGVTTNRDLLVGILREPEFLAGHTDTGYLTRHDPAALTSAAAPAGTTARHALVAALARQAVHRAQAPVLGSLPSGWRNVRSAPQQVTYTAVGHHYEVTYRITGHTVHAEVNGEPVGETLIVHAASATAVDLEADGTRRQYRVHRVGADTWVDASNGSSALSEVPRFGDPQQAAPSGSLLAPMPGLVLRVLADVGSAVTAGQPLLVLEAMKMEQTVTAPADGVLAELRAKAGDQVSTGQILAVVAARCPPTWPRWPRTSPPRPPSPAPCSPRWTRPAGTPPPRPRAGTSPTRSPIWPTSTRQRSAPPCTRTTSGPKPRPPRPGSTRTPSPPATATAPAPRCWPGSTRPGRNCSPRSPASTRPSGCPGTAPP